MQMTRETIRRIQNMLKGGHCFGDIEKMFNVKLSFGRGSYGNANATLKLEIATIGDNGEVNTKEAHDFKRCAVMYGLDKSNFGMTFTDCYGKKFTIVGAKPRSPKFPILGKDADGTTFKFSADAVRRGLGKKDVVAKNVALGDVFHAENCRCILCDEGK